MFKIIILIALIYVVSDVGGSKKIFEQEKTNVRNKRLLFYDEEGNLVKTFTNPYLRELFQKPENYPFYSAFFKPFQNFLQPSNSGTFSPYMIPISDDVVQQINQDPMYQNKLIFTTMTEPTIEPNYKCNGKRTQIPSPNSCSNFLNCWDGWAFEQECPSGLMFSKQGYCDYPHKVDCGNRRLSDETGTSSAQCSKEFDVFRNDAKCNEFFVCVNRSPVKFACPADLYYNTQLGICDYQYRVKCEASLSVNPPGSKQPDMPQASESSAESTSQAPVTKILYMDNMNNIENPGMPQVAMSRQDAIRMLQLNPMTAHHLFNN